MFHDLHFGDVQVSHILSSRIGEWLNSTNEWLRSSWTILHSHLSHYITLDLVEITSVHVNLRTLRPTCATNERCVCTSRRKMNNPNSEHIALHLRDICKKYKWNVYNALRSMSHELQTRCFTQCHNVQRRSKDRGGYWNGPSENAQIR